MPKSIGNVHPNSYDDIFSSEESRQEQKRAQRNIELFFVDETPTRRDEKIR